MKNFFLRDTEARVVEALSEDEPSTSAELAFRSGLTPTRVLEALRMLEFRDLVVLTERQGRAGLEAMLTPDGRAARSLLGDQSGVRQGGLVVPDVETDDGGPIDDEVSVDRELDLILGQ